MRLHQISPLLHFFKKRTALFFTADIFCWWLFFIKGFEVMVALVFIKIVTGAGAVLYYTFNRSSVWYYYYNLHLSRVRLWFFSFFLDLLIFTGGIALLSWIR